LRNALLPVVTIIGLQAGLLLSGAVLTETIFAWPGIGSWLKDAIFNRDYPVLQGGHPLRRDRVRAGQSARRHLVRDHQSEDPGLMSVAELEAQELVIEGTGGLWREARVRLMQQPGALVGLGSSPCSSSSRSLRR
jgi:ABC-type dipeptide/oligopeptide/nickel transport systems, permease components